MALNDNIPRTVAFIIGRRVKSGVSQQTPIGTGFFLGVRIEPPSPRAATLYLVTAAHVVRAEPETWVRLRRMDGSLEDLLVPERVVHDHADVAIAPVELDETGQPFDISWMPVPDFLPAGAPGRYQGEPRLRDRPMLGDRVYFIGLFSPIPAMGERNVPLVRSGTLAAWAQERVPVKLPDGTVLEHTAHLIDCRSYSGFSGSPCFVQFPIEPGIGGVGRPDEETELIGLVSSHFDFKENAGLTGEIAELRTVEVPIHLGVGVVMPAESIEEVLEMEEVVLERRERERRYLLEDPGSPATADPPNGYLS